MEKLALLAACLIILMLLTVCPARAADSMAASALSVEATPPPDSPEPAEEAPTGDESGWFDWFSEDERELALEIAEPYIELRTGPGRGFPIFHVVERGRQVVVLKRRTDWVKVKTPRQKEGWVHADDIEKTLEQGQRVVFNRGSFDNFQQRRWEGGFSGGDLEGANLLSAYIGYAFTENLSIEFTANQALGDVSDSTLLDIGLVHQAFPDWRVSPFFGVGAGLISTDPHSSLVETEDRDDETLHAAVGARIYLARRFMLRAEYRHYMVLTDRDENEELEAWKLGVSVYF
ncbi:SH3 domain-containing protein [Corallincola platygyrae]|uniref:SH3 domain-containing protein n=1 Tax=Corallincola platygyrae TaxID=1193278 RepID=A0ABW4XUH6_9GAMM